tara:strand:+ start:320 stop:547 length:228 start_codon:yes stop_codon:yes gene_type:complete
MENKNYLKLIIDNTKKAKIKELVNKQKKLIHGKIQLQQERIILDRILRQYEDHIILLENKIIKYKRGNNVNRNTK